MGYLSSANRVLIITITILVLGWHILKRCMVEDVELLYVGMNLEKV